MTQKIAHEITFSPSIMEGPPEDGWVTRFPGSEALVWCSCGWTSGVVLVQTARDLFREHQGA